jgi:hypothetical protein
LGKKVELTGGAHLPGTGYDGTRLGGRKGGASRRTWARVVAWSAWAAGEAKRSARAGPAMTRNWADQGVG